MSTAVGFPFKKSRCLNSVFNSSFVISRPSAVQAVVVHKPTLGSVAETNPKAESADVYVAGVVVCHGNSDFCVKYLSIAETVWLASDLNFVSLARLACSIGLIAAITIKAIAPRRPITIKSSTSVNPRFLCNFLILIHPLYFYILNMNH